MPRTRPQLVAVVTGASSGVGRATALELAKRGIALVLASRRATDLDEIARECRFIGSPVLPLAVDVTDQDALHNAAKKTFNHFGHLDIWLNNAAVGLYGNFEVVPASAFRRVIETDFFGYVNGARAALPYFRRQGHGVLVNVASVLGEFAIPHMSSYVAAKHAVVGFSDALRQELRGTGIRVCTILPSSVDTPFYANAGNYTGREVRPVAPVFDPRTVAMKIANAIEGERDRVFVPSLAELLAVARAVFPHLTDRTANRIINRFQIGSRSTATNSGNLYAPTSGNRQLTGGWKRRRGDMRPWVFFAAVAFGLATELSLHASGKWREAA
jgi:short-subunit dehydrogenase